MEETVAGVYRLYSADGASFVGFSRNVRGTLKRLRFELTLNACSFKPLQRFWNEQGPLETELLETLDEAGMSDVELDAHLRALVLKWQRSLGEGTRLVQAGVEA